MQYEHPPCSDATACTWSMKTLTNPFCDMNSMTKILMQYEHDDATTYAVRMYRLNVFRSMHTLTTLCSMALISTASYVIWTPWLISWCSKNNLAQLCMKSEHTGSSPYTVWMPWLNCYPVWTCRPSLCTVVWTLCPISRAGGTLRLNPDTKILAEKSQTNGSCAHQWTETPYH